MWIRFTREPYIHWADPRTRRGYTYFPGETLDLPRAQAELHIANGDAVVGIPPEELCPPDPWLPPALAGRPIVACVWKRGGIYDQFDYVGPLYRAVRRNCRFEHDFVCLTDASPKLMPAGVTHAALRHGWPGFWSKIELFRSDLISQPTLYLDLDTVVSGSIDEILASPIPLMLSWDMDRRWINSSFIRWSVDLGFVYEEFARDPAAAMKRVEAAGGWGDQAWLQMMLAERAVPYRWAQMCFPDWLQWVSDDERRTQPAPEVRISMWYGDPKPHELQTEFLRQHWH